MVESKIGTVQVTAIDKINLGPIGLQFGNH